jgi:hypothetical protein
MRSAGAALVACLGLACGRESPPSAARPEGAPAPREFVYVFAPDGAFVKIDAASFAVVGSGSVQDAGVPVVEAILPDPGRSEIWIRTSRAWSPADLGPAPGVVIVRAAPGSAAAPRLEPVREVAPPPGADRLVGAIVVPGEPRRLVATWAGSGDELPDPVTLLADDGRVADAARTHDFAVGPGSCAAADGSRVFSVGGPPLETRILDTRDLTVQSVPWEPGDRGALSPILRVASRSPCRVLVVGRAAGGAGAERELPAVLYDPERRSALRTLTLEGLAEYALSPDARLVVTDERTVVPNVLPGGETVGVRYEKTGVLRVYAAATGRPLATARLPGDGSLSAIEGSTGYYVTPGRLSVVDLEKGETTATVELPFAAGHVAFLAEP